MPKPERVEVLVLGSGAGGKLLASHMAKAGRRTAVVERKWIGGSCPNINCLPSKNEVKSAEVAHTVYDAGPFGTVVTDARVDMTQVVSRKRKMVEGLVAMQVDAFRTNGAELILGQAHFVALKTVEVALNDGGTRLLSADRVFLDLGTRPHVPPIPGLAETAFTNIELLELEGSLFANVRPHRPKRVGRAGVVAGIGAAALLGASALTMGVLLRRDRRKAPWR